MGTKVEVTYNNLDAGPRVTTWGDKPLLMYFNNVINGKETMAYANETQPGYWHQQSRQWFCNWVVRVYEWNNGNLLNIHTDIFNPYNKRVHFHLDDTASVDEHFEYTQACMEFARHWNLESFTIESPWAFDLAAKIPNVSFAHKILDEGCYVNYVIKKSPSSNYTNERYGMWSMNEEYVFFNHNHPLDPDYQTPYEFARSILFGPDYNKLEEFVPYDWTLNERIVS